MLQPTFGIDPYIEEGMWYFDDPKVGLVHEPLTDGVPELLTPLCKGSCRVGFSDTKMGKPSLTIVREGFHLGSTVYHEVVTGRQCWLCPALLRYFKRPPEVLYIWIWDHFAP